MRPNPQVQPAQNQERETNWWAVGSAAVIFLGIVGGSLTAGLASGVAATAGAAVAGTLAVTLLCVAAGGPEQFRRAPQLPPAPHHNQAADLQQVVVEQAAVQGPTAPEIVVDLDSTEPEHAGGSPSAATGIRVNAAQTNQR